MTARIPRFPDFRPIRISDKRTIEAITAPFRPYSDFNVASLISSNVDNETEISIINDNLAVKLSDYLTNEKTLTFIGDKRVVCTASALLDYARRHDLPNILKLIPEHVVRADKRLKKKFLVKEDPDSHDYILSVRDYCALKGKKFATKRRAINYFTKKYPHYTIRLLDFQKAAHKNRIMKLFDRWVEVTKKNAADVQHEYESLVRFINHAQYFDAHGISLWNNRRLMGFSLLEIDKMGFAQCHFLKSYPERGIFEILDHKAAEFLSTHDVEYINIQQDLGIPGLKKAKLLNRPDHFLKNYTIAPRARA